MSYSNFKSIPKPNPKKAVYRTAMYLRLSKEDGDKQESDSITNQRMMIEDYLNAHPEMKLMDEYVDDGYSGSNFDRPAFKRMYKDIECGAINCVIVKDLSRFGRNYIEVGRYLERIFPMVGLRLIAINDNYDGEKEWRDSSIIVPIKNLLNDAYNRDMSMKVKSQLRAKRKRGDFVASFAPYGYMRDPDHHNKLIIDELAAEQVRLIFKWRLEGMSDQGIAEKLNNEDVLCPAEYKKENGSKLQDNFTKNEQGGWSSKGINRILHNEIYAGNLLQGKRVKPDFRSKAVRNVDQEDWDRVDNTHEAIVDQELFDLVQTVLERDTRIPAGQNCMTLFSGFLECGDCHSPMVRRCTTKNGKKMYCYICNGYKNEKSCTSHYIGHKKLYEAVLNAIRKQAELSLRIERILCDIDEIPLRQRRVKKFDAQLVALMEQVDKYVNLKKKLYEDYSEGLLTREEYVEYSDMYAAKIKRGKEELQKIHDERERILNENIQSEWIQKFKQYRNITELTRPILVELIDKILVYQDKTIEIRFRYDDRFKFLTEIIDDIAKGEEV